MTDTSKQGQRCEDVIRFEVDRLQCQLQIGHSGEHEAYGLEWSDPQTQPSAPAATPADRLIKSIEDYRSGYSAGYNAAQNGLPMRDKDAASFFFNVEGVPDLMLDPSAPAEPSALPVSRNMDYEIPELISNLKADIALYEETGNQQDFVDALAGIKEILRKAEPSAGMSPEPIYFNAEFQRLERAWFMLSSDKDYSFKVDYEAAKKLTEIAKWLVDKFETYVPPKPTTNTE